ncbi:MAG: hypothetical protein QNJ57_07950 [Flavobacteriaceae bacterium]|nr:hypothetical protein [Flavobacteriaceae bacterium]
MAEEILIPLAFFASVFGIIYVYLTARNRERMSMIDKGVDPSIFTTKRNYANMTLKFGMLLVGIALGILVGSFIDEYTTLPEEVGYFSMIFLFGGLALIINSILEDRKAKQ